MATNLSKNFTLEELTKSGTATAKGIKNEPNKEQIENLTQLCKQILQPLRDEWNAPIFINSGFRCDKLNKAVGGATNSDHRFGCAADIQTKEDTIEKNKELFDLIVLMAKTGKIKNVRQIIDEKNYSWIHVSINNTHNKYKNAEVLHLK